uniref:ICA69 domain-containing protein n=1 Tax=Rhodnius prolixus TaxID=13249 RepID=T1HM87_RHOPR
MEKPSEENTTEQSSGSGGVELMNEASSRPVNQFLPSQLLLSNQAALLLDSETSQVNATLDSGKLAVFYFPHKTDNDGQNSDGISAQQNEDSRTKTSWLELFSELDPLSNPDSVGQTSATTEPLRNC